ncbi:hypothetical protein [Celeribacter neptunius]|uniref:Uncharacterized protein n=1 Tax=Celeribacter neptunius TaxID=588602 RepID=A0A1I3LGV4_9RHOB|nr:hypothetical protein [Celeribacter neptunius]SFI84018.1 hypothetical protein SAMN04487991_1027 [Celeribacter neptunius]
MSNHIRLPGERVEQLRMIAEAKNKTISEVIGDYVRSEIEAGTIPADIPGVDVAKSEDGIKIVAGDMEALIPMGEGPTVAEVLASAGSFTAKDIERKKRWIEGAAALSGIEVKRAGNGLKLVSPITKKEYPLNLDVATDLANVIEEAAK